MLPSDDDSSPWLAWLNLLTEGFLIHFKVACFAGFFIAIPFLLYQGWAFVSPGLYLREKRLVWPFLSAMPFMFVAGAAFVYYLVIPNAWHFFLGFQTGAADTGLAIQTEARINDYLNLIMSFLISFGRSAAISTGKSIAMTSRLAGRSGRYSIRSTASTS